MDDQHARAVTDYQTQILSYQADVNKMKLENQQLQADLLNKDTALQSTQRDPRQAQLDLERCRAQMEAMRLQQQDGGQESGSSAGQLA